MIFYMNSNKVIHDLSSENGLISQIESESSAIHHNHKTSKFNMDPLVRVYTYLPNIFILSTGYLSPNLRMDHFR